MSNSNINLFNEIIGVGVLALIVSMATLATIVDSYAIDAYWFFTLSITFFVSYFFSDHNFVFRFATYLCVRWTLFGARENAFIYAAIFLAAGIFAISKVQ